jgi:hypothetical protein
MDPLPETDSEAGALETVTHSQLGPLHDGAIPTAAESQGATLPAAIDSQREIRLFAPSQLTLSRRFDFYRK